MAAPSRIIALNVGAHTVSLAEFRFSSSGGITLNDYRIVPMDSGENVSESVQAANIQIAVAEAMQQMGLKGGAVNYAVSAQSVFTRFVRLPLVDPEKVDQIIQFEAQQNVPFPIHEVVWDYQLVDSSESDKMEVVLVAIKSDLLEGINTSIEASGLKPSVVDVAPMALYNAFRYNYSDSDGCSLLIDIGARTTNLIFIEAKKVFSRSIPIGGSTITSAIAKELEVSGPVAEEKKKEAGYVGLGGSYQQDSDPDVARISKVARNTMTRLHAEITRSISFFRSQQQGGQPVRVFLCGGSASMPYMREFFNEKLQMPVEYFNPLRNVPVTGTMDSKKVSKEAHLLGELVGLGLRATLDCPMELNLSPASVTEARKLEKKRPYIILTGLCILLSIAGWWLYFNRATEIKGEMLSQVQKKVQELQVFEGKFKKVREQIKKEEIASQPFIEAASDRQYWTTLLEDISNRLPELYVWITVFEPSANTGDKQPITVTPETYGKGSGGKSKEAVTKIDGIRLKGLYLNNPRNEQVVNTFAESLGKSELLENVEIIVRSDPSSEKWAHEYEIKAKLKNPINLP